jgi:PAS domain S-box-containing protein
VKLRYTPARLALSYIALGVLALVLFAVPLWYGFRANLGTFRAYVPGEEMQRLVDVFHRNGPQALAAAVDAYAKGRPPGEVAILADPQKRRLAGNLPRWPAEVPDAPGTYGLVIGLDDDASMRVVTSHVTLPDGYRLLMGRESVRFDSLVALFWYGIAGAVAIVLTLGLVLGWLLRRAHGQLEALVGQRTAQLRNSEVALRQSEERYARVMQASEDGFWEWIVASDEFYASPRMLAIYGLPPDTVFHGRADFLSRFPFHPEDLELWRKAVAAHLAGERARVNIEVRAELQGKTRWILLTAICSRDASGAEERWTGSVSDVTGRRRAQEALLRSEERYSSAMEASEEGYVDVNVDTGEFVTSERLNEIFGIARGTRFRGRSDFLSQFRFYGNDGETYQQAIRAIAADGGPDRYQFEFRIVLPSGEVRWIWTRGKVTRDAEGRPRRRVGVFADITAHKRAQQELQLSEERYARAMEGSDAGHWDWNIVTDEMFISERAREMLALPAGALPERRSEIMDLVPMPPDDRAAMNEKVSAGIRSGIHERDYRVIARPGEVRWLRSRAKVYRDARGAAVCMTGSLTDITERKLAADALRASEERYSLAMEASEEGHFDWNVRTDDIFVSVHVKKVFGLPLDADYRTRSELVANVRYHPEDRAWLDEMPRNVLGGAALRHEFEYRILRGEEVRWMRVRWKIFRDDAGVALRVIGVVTDNTDRKRAADALKRSEERFALAVAGSNDGLWDWDILTNDMFLSERAQRIYGLEPGHTIRPRAEWRALVKIHPDDAEGQLRNVEDYLAGKSANYEGEWRVLHPDGRYHWIRIRGTCVRDAEGRPTRFAGSVSDIDVRRGAEEALRRSESYLAEALRLGRAGSFAYDVRAHRQVHWSPTTYEILDFDPAGGLPAPEEVYRRVHPEDVERVREARGKAMSGKADYDAHYRIVRRDGTIRHLHATGHPALDANGEIAELVGVVTDVTERKRAEQELRDSEARFRALTELSSDWYWRQDEDLRFTYISHQVADRYPMEWVIGKKRWELPGVTPLSSGWAEHQAVLAARQPFRDLEYVRVGQDGRTEYVSVSGAPMFDGQGIFRGYQGVGRNITERRRAEEELKALERKLRQAQRLEAMGTLAGGIAHDFNNILGAILGFGEMALRAAAKGSRLRRDLDSIMAAGERGRALVDRVLAFSRSGVSERVPVHVEKVVREALDLLSAKLPPSITLHAKLHAAGAAMQGDATQVHQVLMNLATNAVQAMPAGGMLRVSLRAGRIERSRTSTIGAIAPGDYLVLEVSDTGTGIPAEILDRIFDPFFTTKEVGTGTGLGLSLVHGIVTELGGAIDVASAVGAGTRFAVYLPRAGDVAETDSREELALPRGDGQRVLVVDDEEPLVKLATRTLEELGYAPIGFTSGTAALAAFRADPERFDAVITDERMPGMSGSTLIRTVRGIRDRIPIVLMSGYIGGAVARQAREAGAEEVLKKPLSARDLATSLARVLRS